MSYNDEVLYEGKYYHCTYNIENDQVDFKIWTGKPRDYYGRYESCETISGFMNPNRLLYLWHMFSVHGFYPMVGICLAYVTIAINYNISLLGILIGMVILAAMAMTKYDPFSEPPYTVSDAMQRAIDHTQKLDMEKEQQILMTRSTENQINDIVQSQKQKQEIIQDIERTLLT